MKITAIELKNVRGFQQLPRTEFSNSMNVFIGPNNAGKSTILSSIYLMQKVEVLGISDQTIGSSKGEVRLFSEGDHQKMFGSDPDRVGFVFHLNNGSRHILHSNGGESNWGSSTVSAEPKNFIYPYLSKRKVTSYSQEVHKGATNAVNDNFVHLYSKIDRLINPEYSRNKNYTNACNDILGFQITTSAGDGNGKQAMYLLDLHEEIPLTSMGEGVANILGLIVDLCVAEDKIFLIEEPENDIHPQALKALLNLIVDKSSTNQFFISTHSNIVMRVLGGSDSSKIFEITSSRADKERPKLFVSKIKEISTKFDRRRVLEDLGYEFFDLGQYEAYLFLEESSAEVIIRDHLVHWFAKGLVNKLKTYSSGGLSKMEKRFEEFNNLFVFMNLEPIYKSKAWVLVDAGEEEQKVIDKLKKTYVAKHNWNESCFDQFSQHDFEEYYPKVFKEKFYKEIKNAEFASSKDKQDKKAELLSELKIWMTSNPQEAKDAFKISAADVIVKLKEIEKCLSAVEAPS